MKMKTYLLIDRSASMASCWPETIGAIKAFTAEVRGKLLVALFDAQKGMDFAIGHDAKAKAFDPEAVLRTYRPRGMTPLNDAVLALSERVGSDAPKKAQIVIMTDGYENASNSTAADAARVVARWEKQGYDVVWLGASFNAVYTQSRERGLSAGKTVNMASSDTYLGTMAAVGMRNRRYAEGTVAAADELDDDIRQEAAGG